MNLVGQSACASGNFKDTVILITWDDWGGWYDHVSPASSPQALGYSNQTGQNNVYGFRVPLLVVSAWSPVVPTNPPTQGYVSGAWTSGPQPTLCQNAQYCHDFGSILNFIEYVFGRGGVPLQPIGPTIYPYADALARDTPANCGAACPYSLSDFFNFNLSKPNTFYPITVPNGLGPDFFINYQGSIQPPDLD